MISKQDIKEYHEQMLVEFLRSLARNDDVQAMMLIALRPSSEGVSVEVHCGGSTHDIYRAASTLLESVLKPGTLGTSRILGEEEATRVKWLSALIMALAGYDHDDVHDLEFESGPELFKRK